MSFFGLDIGSSSFKVTQVTKMGSSFGIDAIGAIVNPISSVDFSDVTLKQRASDALKKLLSEMGMKERRVVLGISESKVFSRVVSMPAMSDAELASAINWEAEQFVPMPIAEVEMDYSIVRRPLSEATDQTMLVYLLASPKKYLEEVLNFAVGVGLEPIAIESEMVGVSRSLTYGGLSGTSILVNIGATASTIAIVDGDSLLFSYVFPVGGFAMSRALAQSLSFPLPQAEEYKRTYGLDGRQFEGKVKTALLVVINSLVGDLRKAIEYHTAQYKTAVVRIMLVGGGAYLPELTTYLSGEFPGIEVSVADPFLKSKSAKRVNLPSDRASYAVAVGLALREF